MSTYKLHAQAPAPEEKNDDIAVSCKPGSETMHGSMLAGMQVQT